MIKLCRKGHLSEKNKYGYCKECKRLNQKKWNKRLRQYYKEYAKTVVPNPDTRKVVNSKYNARKINAEGSFTTKDILKLRQKQNDQCVYCLSDLQGRGHIDHRMPLARGGDNTVNNLQLLCASCNCSKGAKTHEEFIAYLEGEING